MGRRASSPPSHTRGNALAFCSQTTTGDQFRTEIGRRDSTSKLASRARLRYVSLISDSLTIGTRSFSSEWNEERFARLGRHLISSLRYAHSLGWVFPKWRVVSWRTRVREARMMRLRTRVYTHEGSATKK